MIKVKFSIHSITKKIIDERSAIFVYKQIEKMINARISKLHTCISKNDTYYKIDREYEICSIVFNKS